MRTDNEIARYILAYLIEHPEAQDTLEGITEWWLLEQRIKYHTKLVQKALEELVERGLILERKTQNSKTRYQMNQQKMKDIQMLISVNQKSD